MLLKNKINSISAVLSLVFTNIYSLFFSFLNLLFIKLPSFLVVPLIYSTGPQLMGSQIKQNHRSDADGKLHYERLNLILHLNLEHEMFLIKNYVSVGLFILI